MKAIWSRIGTMNALIMQFGFHNLINKSFYIDLSNNRFPNYTLMYLSGFRSLCLQIKSQCTQLNCKLGFKKTYGGCFLRWKLCQWKTHFESLNSSVQQATYIQKTFTITCTYTITHISLVCYSDITTTMGAHVYQDLTWIVIWYTLIYNEFRKRYWSDNHHNTFH